MVGIFFRIVVGEKSRFDIKQFLTSRAHLTWKALLERVLARSECLVVLLPRYRVKRFFVFVTWQPCSNTVEGRTPCQKRRKCVTLLS
jgi:hypothetical protein